VVQQRVVRRSAGGGRVLSLHSSQAVPSHATRSTVSGLNALLNLLDERWPEERHTRTPAGGDSRPPHMPRSPATKGALPPLLSHLCKSCEHWRPGHFLQQTDSQRIQSSYQASAPALLAAPLHCRLRAACCTVYEAELFAYPL
jgi:hypothetical protein